MTYEHKITYLSVNKIFTSKTLWKLERWVIDRYIEKIPFIWEQFSEQYISKILYSGSWFFIDFQIPDEVLGFTQKIGSPIDWPHIESPELETCWDAILFHKHWKIYNIDIHSHDSKDIPINIAKFTLTDE